MQPLDTLSFILQHPLGRQHPVATLRRFARWQILSRFREEVIIDWIEGATLGARRGMTGATGNIYCGIHEFAEMAFLLHLLRPGDLFLDIGANVGSYTILASKVCGSRSIAFEPDPLSASSLRRNIALNTIEHLVKVEEFALGARSGEVAFTVGCDTMNRVASAEDQNSQLVKIKRLDDIPEVNSAVYAKLDVEGFEDEVIMGGINLLSSPNLIAIQCESHGETATAVLNDNGFEEFFYDPFSRSLSKQPLSFEPTNTLFVRDPEQVILRVRESPQRTIYESVI